LESAPLSAERPEVAALLQFTRFLWDEMRRPASAFNEPRIALETGHLFAALLARCQLGDAADGPRTSPDSLRRAEEFLADHLKAPVSLAEAAGASGQSVRSLSRAFRRKHGMGAIGFLRRLRLEAARSDLEAAERGETTVAEVAFHYGFGHLGHFARAYRTQFGETPSETLRR
jgi:transcriptional regulator GlxA family with amidase domain